MPYTFFLKKNALSFLEKSSLCGIALVVQRSSLAIVGIVVVDTNGDNAARPTVESASSALSPIGALIEQQQEALERATFVGMDAEEKAEYDNRAQRISRLQHALNTRQATEIHS